MLYFIYVHIPIFILACGEDQPSIHLWQKITTTNTNIIMMLNYKFVSNFGPHERERVNHMALNKNFRRKFFTRRKICAREANKIKKKR